MVGAHPSRSPVDRNTGWEPNPPNAKSLEDRVTAPEPRSTTGADGGPGGDGDGPVSGEPCDRCGHELSVIRILVDGNTLLMESCDGCDARRWQLSGERIDLQQALDEVGEHAGRRR